MSIVLDFLADVSVIDCFHFTVFDNFETFNLLFGINLLNFGFDFLFFLVVLDVSLAIVFFQSELFWFLGGFFKRKSIF